MLAASLFITIIYYNIIIKVVIIIIIIIIIIPRERPSHSSVYNFVAWIKAACKLGWPISLKVYLSLGVRPDV